MPRKRHTDTAETPTSGPVLPDRAQANNLTDAGEQLATEVEELRRQLAELHELKDEDQRAIRDWEWLARLAEENPDPVLRVALYGVILYRNPASISLCRQWNPDDELAVPQAVQKLASAAYAGAQVMRGEMTFGERTYLVTVAPAPPAKYVNIYARDITDRKQAEEALRQSEAMLDAFFKASPWILNIEDEEFRYVKTDRVTPTYFGLDTESIVGKSVRDLAPEFLRDHGDMMRRVMETGQPAENVEVKYPVPSRPGEMAYWQASYFPVPLPQGKRGIGIVGVDTTEFRKTQRALRERIKELACLYAVSRDIQEGLSVDELCRRAVEHLLPAMQFPESAVAVIELNGKRFASENYTEGLTDGLHVEIRVRGEVPGRLTIYYAQERPFLIPEEQNLVNGVAGALSTWLERKGVEEKYRHIVETATEGIVMADAEARMIFVNDRWSEIFGYGPEEARHITLLDLVFPEDRARMAKRWESRKRGRKERYEFRFRRKDGSPVWLLVGVAPQIDSEERFLGTLVMVTDITKRKQAEKELRRLNATLEHRVAQRTAELQHRASQLQKLTLELAQTEDRERKRMAEILHDDLQQILAAAKFHLSMMRNRVGQDGSLQALGAQIDEMLKKAIEKSRSLAHELSPAVLYHKDFIEILGWLAGQIEVQHGLAVHVRAHGKVDLPSDTLTNLLYRAAQELLFNVVKHARVKEAAIAVRQHGRYVCLSVSDQGRGFDPQQLREVAGYGLLSIRERVELLGGRVKIRSTPGKGSTVLVIVPTGQMTEDGRQTTVGVGPRAYPTPGGHGGPPLRVLLADDHRIVREGLRSLLHDQPDVEVVGEAAHGREAVDLALRLEPDVVIMDFALPLIDGDVVTRQIKEHLPRTRVIALSMYNEPDKMERMFRAGAESYVLKTAPAEELLAAIRGDGGKSSRGPQ